MRVAVLVSLAALALAASAPAARAQCRLETFPHFGLGSIDGNRAAVGTGHPDPLPRVRFFAEGQSGWEPDGEAVAGDLTVFYPASVSIDGDRCLVGAAEANNLSGALLLFERVGGAWIPTPLTWSSTGPAEFVGAVVALDGDVAVAGADHWVMGGGDGSPLAHVFERGAAGWNEVAQLQGYEGPTGALALEGTTILFGDDRTALGQVLVHERIGGAWVPTQTLTSPAPAQEPHLGSSVAIDGDLLAAGASWPGNVNAGRVEIFRRQAGTWAWAQTLQADAPAIYDQFGASVSLAGRTLIVGSPGAAGGGRVHRFEHDGTGFVHAGSFPPGTAGHSFGWAVAGHGEDALVAEGLAIAFWRLGFAQLAVHCPATPNSTGATGVLAAEGCDSVSGARLVLRASSLPRHVLVAPICGPNAAQQPFGDGFRCVGSPIHRLPGGSSDASGAFALDVDFAAEPATRFAAGRTFHFQALHRDPASPGAGLNATNAVAIGFAP